MSTIACGVSGKPCPTEAAFPPCDGAGEKLISLRPIEGNAPAINLSNPARETPTGNFAPTLDQLNAMLTEESTASGKTWIEMAGYPAICRSDDKPYRFFAAQYSSPPTEPARRQPPPAGHARWNPAIDAVQETIGVELNEEQLSTLRSIVGRALLDSISSEEIAGFAHAIIDTGDADDFLYRLFALVSLAGARNLVGRAGPEAAFVGDMFALEEEVGAAVADGRISFERRENEKAGLLRADYLPDDNAILFPPLDIRKFPMLSALMVHELTHAQQDLEKRVIRRIDAEEEGYVREWTIEILRAMTRKEQSNGLPWCENCDPPEPILHTRNGVSDDLYNACQQAIVDALRSLGSPEISEFFREYYRLWFVEQPTTKEPIDEIFAYDGI